jgi:hypothetical protein
MNRKMTDLALGWCGGDLAARGFLLDASDSRLKSEANAREPKPQKASRRNARLAGNRSQ